ncbi:hypothetical protein ACFLX8_04095 [Chloroflexota bacterium]
MSQLSKTSSDSNLAGKTPNSQARDETRKHRRTTFIIASAVLILILIIVGVSYYFSENARYRRLTVITVDDTTVSMDSFLMKTRLAGIDPMIMMDTLTNEQLIKLEAPQYIAEVSPEDIAQELRRMAHGEGETISESEFKEWYRQLLNEIDLTDSEYKEIVTTGLLSARLSEYLAARVPTVAEQIHLHSVSLNAEDMEKIWGEEKEDRDKLASEIWQAKQSEAKVNDEGWLPRGILPYGFDLVAFSLTIGDISEPVAHSGEDPTSDELYYYLLMVSEKADAQDINEESLQILQDRALDDWLLEEIELHNITWNFNSEIYAWVNWQLAQK